MLPQHRLGTLLEQAKSHQRSQCPFHSGDVSISLLADCHCDPASFPSLTTHILKAHTDEIWRLEFSHNGDWLATAGRDQTAIIWNVKVISNDLLSHLLWLTLLSSVAWLHRRESLQRTYGPSFVPCLVSRRLYLAHDG